MELDPLEPLRKEMPMNELPVMQEGEGITLFHPHVPATAIQAVTEVLQSKWIGQGPRVELFEKEFKAKFCGRHSALAVGSGTDALHLAYILAGIEPGDEVISPVFTCTATNIPLLYLDAKIRFADIDPETLNINVRHVRELINDQTKAIVCVHYGGLPCDMEELTELAGEFGIPIIEDAAAALGATYRGKAVGSISDFTAFSFQAIKHITTGDGGMLVLRDNDLAPLAERIRWFGIDRTNKQKGTWENDIRELGYKYQMTDIGAAMGLAALAEFDSTLAKRQMLLRAYRDGLRNVPGIKLLGSHQTDRTHAAWLCTVRAEKRPDLMRWLRQYNIESGQVHYRNDRYTVLGGRRNDLPLMDEIEDDYLVLPLHLRMTVADVEYICSVIRKGW